MGYRGKQAERARARLLRAEAWTLQEIADELGVAKSSVSLWVRDVAFDPARRRGRAAPPRRAPNALQRRKQAEIDRLRYEGAQRIGRLTEKEFLVAGAALYAGDGAKGDRKVRFANSNPDLIGFFCAWLRQFFDVDESRLRVALYLHQGLPLEEAMAFWSHVTGIAPGQFHQPYRAVADGSIRATKHRYGCCHVVYSCSRTHRAIMGLVQALVSSGCRPG